VVRRVARRIRAFFALKIGGIKTVFDDRLFNQLERSLKRSKDTDETLYQIAWRMRDEYTAEEIAQDLKIDLKRVQEKIKEIWNILGIDPVSVIPHAPEDVSDISIEGRGGGSLLGQMPELTPDEKAIANEALENLKAADETLYQIFLRKKERRTNAEIGEEFGISATRVWQRLREIKDFLDEDIVRAILAMEPTPEMADCVIEEGQSLFDQSEDETRSTITQLMLAGCTPSQIAKECNLTLATVEVLIDDVEDMIHTQFHKKSEGSER
jgi:DNA-directed RNA polymerase specialized sigma24 family protein